MILILLFEAVYGLLGCREASPKPNVASGNHNFVIEKRRRSEFELIEETAQTVRQRADLRSHVIGLESLSSAREMHSKSKDTHDMPTTLSC